MEVDFKGLIFDFDGVLCNTDWYHQRAWKDTLEHHGISVDDVTLRRLNGKTDVDLFRRILDDVGVTVGARKGSDLLAEKTALYNEILSSITPESLDSLVIPTLEKLKELGYSLSVACTSSDGDVILEKLGIRKLFNRVEVADTKGKSFMECSRTMYLDNRECLVIEDKESAIEEAMKLGFYTAGIGEASKSSISDYMLADFSDLLLFL